ncbi:hypothetical protein B0J12DRAFT_86671 [Macrophomina phaseolina]|uniref:MARVEL domain-containing protein n=1 Tax=Macrophomina phaseolina TaxID=35725 RepID=A0ABQ8GAE6_9PEZI|nr:hypothetical protein B0J12DRAFT_86671 [Macrophomina phaseolina]
MSYHQPYRPRPRRPERTPSTNDVIPFPPSAPAAAGAFPVGTFQSQPLQQPRIPFASESPRPGSSGSQRSQPRGIPGPGPYQYPSRPGTSSSQRQDDPRPRTASSSRSNFGPGVASPRRADPYSGTPSPSRPEYRPGTGPSSRGTPPLGPGHARVTSPDAALSPLHQATAQSDLREVPLSDAHAAPSAPTPIRPPTLPPPPANLAAPTTRSRFSDISDAGGVATNNSISNRLPSSLTNKSGWPRLAQWTLLPLILCISGAVAILMGHSLSLYGGLKVGGTVDNTVSTHAVWPSDVNLLPTWLLLGCGFASFCSSIVVWGLSLRQTFMKPVKRLAGTRVAMGIVFVGAWIASLVVYKLFETGDGGDSLGKYACDHQGEKVVGQFEVARVCTEQTTGFGLAILSAILEIALIACFALRSLTGDKDGTLDYLNEKSSG